MSGLAKELQPSSCSQVVELPVQETGKRCCDGETHNEHARDRRVPDALRSSQVLLHQPLPQRRVAMIPEVFSALDPASTVARLLADAVGLPAVARPGRRLFMVVVPAVAMDLSHPCTPVYSAGGVQVGRRRLPARILVVQEVAPKLLVLELLSDRTEPRKGLHKVAVCSQAVESAPSPAKTTWRWDAQTQTCVLGLTAFTSCACFSRRASQSMGA